MTQNQKEFKKLQAKIKRLIREVEKEGVTFIRSPLPEAPKRITQKRLDLLSRINKRTVRKYAEYVSQYKTPPIEYFARRQESVNPYQPHPKPEQGNDYIRKGRKGRKKGSKNKKPMTPEIYKKRLESLEKARKAKRKKPRKKKPKGTGEKKKRKPRVIEPEPPTPEAPTPPTPEPEEPEIESPEEPDIEDIPEEADIIIDNLRSILDSTQGFKGLAQLLIQSLDQAIAEQGKETIANRIKSLSNDIIDRAKSLSIKELRYREEAIQLSIELLYMIIGDDVPFEKVEDIHSTAYEDSKDVPQYHAKRHSREQTILKEKARKPDDFINQELSKAKKASKFAEYVDTENV